MQGMLIGHRPAPVKCEACGASKAQVGLLAQRLCPGFGRVPCKAGDVRGDQRRSAAPCSGWTPWCCVCGQKVQNAVCLDCGCRGAEHFQQVPGSPCLGNIPGTNGYESPCLCQGYVSPR